MPSLEAKLGAIQKSIGENISFEVAKSTLKEILGSEPKIERSAENIRDKVILSELRPSCDTAFHFLIGVMADEHENLRWLKVSAKHSPAGYSYEGLSRDFDEMRQRRIEQAKEAATRACVARESRRVERRVSNLVAKIAPPMTFWETKNLIDKSLGVTSEIKNEVNPAGDRLAYASIKLCDTTKNYLFNLDGDGVGRIKRLRFWVQEPGEEYSLLEKFTREYEAGLPMPAQSAEDANAQASASTVNPSAPPKQQYESYWTVNENLMGLVRDGSRLTFYYVQPRQGMMDLVRTGTQWMTGDLERGSFVGTARVFSKRCGALEYPVSGKGDGDGITISGYAPKIDSSCNILEYTPIVDGISRHK